MVWDKQLTNETKNLSEMILHFIKLEEKPSQKPSALILTYDWNGWILEKNVGYYVTNALWTSQEEKHTYKWGICRWQELQINHCVLHMLCRTDVSAFKCNKSAVRTKCGLRRRRSRRRIDLLYSSLNCCSVNASFRCLAACMFFSMCGRTSRARAEGYRSALIDSPEGFMTASCSSTTWKRSIILGLTLILCSLQIGAAAFDGRNFWCGRG